MKLSERRKQDIYEAVDYRIGTARLKIAEILVNYPGLRLAVDTVLRECDAANAAVRAAEGKDQR